MLQKVDIPYKIFGRSCEFGSELFSSQNLATTHISHRIDYAVSIHLCFVKTEPNLGVCAGDNGGSILYPQIISFSSGSLNNSSSPEQITTDIATDP